MKNYDLIIFSRANFECIQLDTTAPTIKDACSAWQSVVKEYLKSTLADEDPDDYDCATIEDVVEQEFDAGEFYMVSAFDSSAENVLVF